MALVTQQERSGGSRSLPRTRTWKRYSSRTFYLFISPWLLGFVGLTVAPFVYAFLMSFSSYDGISIWRWVGLKNYLDILHDPDALYSMGRTVLYMVITVPLSIGIGLGLALLLNRQMRGIGIFRTIFYLPAVVPIVASAIIWRAVFDRDTGVLNAIVEFLKGPSITWLLDPTAFYAMIIMVLWGVGGSMIISLAGLQGIPNELKEASRVDGANGWQTFRSVTLPLLSPILFFEVVLGVIGSLQTLIQPLLLVESSTVSQSYLIPRGNYLYMVHVYEQFLYYQRFGYGSALLWVLFVFILLITLLVFRTSLFWVYYEVDRQKG